MVFTILVIIVLILLACNIRSIKNWISIQVNLHKLPGPPSTGLLFGNIKALYDTPDNLFKTGRRWASQYNSIYKLWACHVVTCNIVNPHDLELILSNPKHLKKPPLYNLSVRWLGTGLLTSSGRKWQIRRKILTPAFHFKILKDFIDVFNEETDSLVDSIKKECHKSEICVNGHVIQFTLKSLAQTAMGTKLNFDSTSERDYKSAILEIARIYLHRMLHPWYDIFYIVSPLLRRELSLVKLMHEFTTNIIRKREANFELPPTNKAHIRNKRLAMLDLLLTCKQEEGLIDDEGIREEVDTFMFEGHDTTSVPISFGLMLLACNPEAQSKIVDEIREVLDNVKRKPTYNDLQEMKYLDMCIKEILRIYPSVPFIARQLEEEVVTASGYRLPKNSVVHMHLYDIHHDADLYPDPEKFDPDRFLPENSRDRHPFSYVPFSAGARNCIGQKFAILELKAVFCGILANFVLEPVDTPSSIVLVADIVLRTKDDIRVKFVPRIVDL